MKRILSIGLLFILLAAAANSAHAQDSAVQTLNALRISECAGRKAGIRPVRINSKLNAAAKFVKSGSKTSEALKRAGYRADQSSMIHLGGPMDDAYLKRVLMNNYCKTLTDPGLIEVGVVRTEKEIVVVLAAPFAPPLTSDAGKVASEVLQYVNHARAKTRNCGRKSFGAAPPLTLNATLLSAATSHAKDMAERGRISHEGSDGSQPAVRVSRVGYKWKSVGENVAAGPLSAREVVDGWLGSPGHCENIMDPRYTQMAVAYVVNTKQEIGIYWAQVFATPRSP